MASAYFAGAERIFVLGSSQLYSGLLAENLHVQMKLRIRSGNDQILIETPEYMNGPEQVFWKRPATHDPYCYEKALFTGF